MNECRLIFRHWNVRSIQDTYLNFWYFLSRTTIKDILTPFLLRNIQEFKIAAQNVVGGKNSSAKWLFPLNGFPPEKILIKPWIRDYLDQCPRVAVGLGVNQVAHPWSDLSNVNNNTEWKKSISHTQNASL